MSPDQIMCPECGEGLEPIKNHVQKHGIKHWLVPISKIGSLKNVKARLRYTQMATELPDDELSKAEWKILGIVHEDALAVEEDEE